MERSRTFKIALGGICLALSLILMFAGSIVPGIELTLFALSSLFTAVMIIETGVGGGVLLYIAAGILGFLLIPGKLAILPYIGFFGYWGILKYFLEKISTPVLQILSKCAFFVLILCAGLWGFRGMIAQSISLPDYPVFLLIAAGTVLLLLYDFIFSFILNFYFRRFKGNPERMKLS